MTGLRPDAVEELPVGRRRLDRLLSEGYLAGLEDLALPVLRQRRREAEQEDADLTFRRDLVQGRLALVRAEMDRRRRGAPAGDLAERLPEILTSSDAGEAAGSRFPRAQPSLLHRRRRLEDRLLADTAVPDVQLHDQEDLQILAATLEEFDVVLSQRRARVQAVVDALSGELARRYAKGEASVDELLREAAQPAETPRE